MTAVAEPTPHAAPPEERRVVPLELFFDLVFVFALTQVTALLAADLSWAGLARGLLMLAALWWAWVGYAWLTNAIDPEEGATRIAIFVAMAAMLVASLCVPRGFADDAVPFAIAYGATRAMQVVLFWLAARRREDTNLLSAVRRLGLAAVIGPGLILVATAFDGAVQGALWALALALDYGGVWLVDSSKWHGVSPGHFAERHALVIIIALGESIVALGVGATDLAITGEVVLAVVLGLTVAAALWWMYFDVVALVAERRLRAAEGAARNAQARDSYSFLHLPMVAGIVLFALGVKKVLAGVDDPLKAVAAVGLCGGVALYLAAHVLFRLRNVHTLARRRVAAAVVLAAWIPAATHGAAVLSLAWVALVCVLLVAYETVRYREARERVRHALG